MKNLKIYLFLSILMFVGCDTTNETEKKISQINIQYDFVPFHKEFYNANEESLYKLKNQYPYLFPSQIKNEEWLAKIKESDEKILFQMVDSIFGNLKTEKEKIHKLYQHIKYYSPTFQVPTTFTLVNGLDYENSIVYADSLLFVSLDMYLGKNSEVYQSFPKYISNNYTKNHITVDIARKIIHKQFNYTKGRSFLESMIYFGKELYLLKTLLPNVPMYVILGYEEEKYNWALQNEIPIWKFFISEAFLFSTDTTLNKRFIDTAPFSKFYLENDSESPGKIGTWIGLKIIESYMKNNDTSLLEMTRLDAETILKKSRYKPLK